MQNEYQNMQAIWDLVGQWSSTEVRLSEACRAHLQQKSQDLEEAKATEGAAQSNLEDIRRGYEDAMRAEEEARRQLSRHVSLYQSRLNAVAEAVHMSRGGGSDAIAQALAMARDCGEPDVFEQECESLRSQIAEAEERVSECEKSVKTAEGRVRLASEHVATIEAQMREIKTIQRQIEKKVD